MGTKPIFKKAIFKRNGRYAVLKISPHSISVISYEKNTPMARLFFLNDIKFVDGFVEKMVDISRLLEPDSKQTSYLWGDSDEMKRYSKERFANILCRHLIKEIYNKSENVCKYLGGNNVYTVFTMLVEEEVMRWIIKRIDNA
jgi:hypothetical protein